MKIVYLNLDELKRYKNNPRINDHAVEKVAKSIEEFGFKVPIVIDKDYTIIAGDTRYKASKLLGLETVPCIIASDLDEEKINAFRLADNKVGEIAEWDLELLEKEFEKILNIDMFEFGFDLIEEVEQEEKEDKPEIEFTNSLDEEHNYIVLYFDNDIDWLQAQSLFDIKTVKELSTKKDGTIKNERKGIGRVLNGAKTLSKLTEGYFNEDKH